ncbi:DDE-type integrase/transposase/recombinase [Nocardia sp. NPDC004750]
MRGAGLQGAFLRKKWRLGSTRQDPRATPAPDLVNRDFTAGEPDWLWVADATRIVCGEGVFWLAAVRDAFSNWIVGWKCSDRCDTELILGALEYAVWTRDVRDGSWSIIPTVARPTRRSGSRTGWPTTGSHSRWGRSVPVTTTLSWRTSSLP